MFLRPVKWEFMVKLGQIFLTLLLAGPAYSYDEYKDETGVRVNQNPISAEQLDYEIAEGFLGVSGAPLTGEEEGVIEIEPSNILPSDLANSYILVPYRARRKKWGYTATVSYSLFVPQNYESNYVSSTIADFETLYGDPSLPLLEFGFNYKRNFAIGSLGGEGAIGAYSSESNVDISTASLSLTFFRLGVKYTMDNMFLEPYFAPYFGGGLYSVLFKEEQGATSFNGNTQVSFYYTLGTLIQLDWVDREAAKESYLDSGIENTFVFIEARQFMASQAAADPDFSTELHLNAGLTLEF